MLDMASSNIKTLGGFLQAEPVGPYERADKGMEALQELVGDGRGREGGRKGKRLDRKEDEDSERKFLCLACPHVVLPSLVSFHSYVIQTAAAWVDPRDAGGARGGDGRVPLQFRRPRPHRELLLRGHPGTYVDFAALCLFFPVLLAA